MTDWCVAGTPNGPQSDVQHSVVEIALWVGLAVGSGEERVAWGIADQETGSNTSDTPKPQREQREIREVLAQAFASQSLSSIV